MGEMINDADVLEIGLLSKKIGIVTDSTADFPPSWYDQNDVIMVPLEVRFGDEVFRDWVDIEPPEFYRRLAVSEVLPKTSQPPPEAFAAVYRSLADKCDRIISVHISSKLSGTSSSAAIAAKDSPVPVKVIDTGQASLATGLIVKELVALRREGADISEMDERARRLSAACRIFLCVDTLKYLEMGGRLGRAQALAGSLLDIKPILTVTDGEVAPLVRVRGRNKVFRALVEQVKEFTGESAALFGFAHADAPEAAQRLRDELAAAGFNTAAAPETVIGAVIGTYTGPGAFAVVARKVWE